MTIYTLPPAQEKSLFDAETPVPQGYTPAQFMEPTLFYDPPYRNQVDDTLAWHLVKFLPPTCGLRYRVAVSEGAPTVRPVDFIIETKGRRIGLDLLRGDEADPLRDALVLGSGMADVLYQIRADDLTDRIYDAIYLLARWDASLFDERSLINLNRLASDEAKATDTPVDDALLRVHYTEEMDLFGEEVSWLSDETLLVHRRLPEHVVQDFDAALARYGIGPEALTHPYHARSA